MDATETAAKLLREELALAGPAGPARRYPDSLKARVVAWAEPLIIAGRGKMELAASIGLPWETLARWIREAALGRRARSLPPAPSMSPVRVVPDAQAQRFSVRSPKGFVVEGLDFEATVALLTRLG